MANRIVLKRSSVSTKTPTTTDLALGELAINTYDGKMYLKRNNGVDTIVEVGAVTSVAGRIGAVTLNKTDVGLGDVDNTSDENKPVSTAQSTAIALKQNLSEKDATGGYAGLTAFQLNLKNATNTFTNFLTNTTTASRTWSFQDRSGTIADLGANTFTANQSLGNNSILGVRILGFNGELDNGNSGTVITITLATAQKQKVTLNSATPTITISTAGAQVGNYQVRIIQDATGGRVPTFSGLLSTRWLGRASTPSTNTTANGETILTMYFDGTNITQSMTKVGAV